MSQAEQSAEDIRRIEKKTEQVLRIFGTLWDKRLSSLDKYFRKRYAFKFLFWQGKRGTAEEVTGAFSKLVSELNNVNAREQNVLILITENLDITIAILEKAYLESKQLHECLTVEIRQKTPGLSRLEETEVYLINVIKRYKELTRRQEEILILERDLIENQTEDKWKLYLIRLEGFAAEMRQIISFYETVRKREKRYLHELNRSIEDLRNFSLRKSATAYIGPSVVSAIVRVFGANIVSQGILMSFGKVNFWEFTSLTTIFVTGINFTDYYYGWATKLSNRIAKFLKIAK